MAKYSFEFKLKIIQEYLEGKGGATYLSKKYGVKSASQVKNWINTYRELGEEGLFQKRQHQIYSVQFKLDAIELYQTSELSYREVANCLEMNNPTLIGDWMQKFRKEGIEGLSKMKGRPSTLPKKTENSTEKFSNKPSKEHDRIKKLEKQVRSLQIENAFLKELRKLRKREAQQKRMKQSHESFTASEDNSN